jgi:hypothetical protein
MARKRRVSHESVVKYALINPEMLQKDIGAHFNLSANHVSLILRTAGSHRGRRNHRFEQKRNQTDEQAYWEKLLIQWHLGMDTRYLL